MTDQQWADFFAALRSNRDRALVALAVSNGARAAEILGLRGCDVDWGEQRIRVVRKGTGAVQWLPTSAEALVWLRLHLAGTGAKDPRDPLWCTVRRRDHGSGLQRQPLTYEALRAVFRRANEVLGSNWSMHDLRHTCAMRMARDPALTLRDVQVILGHRHLSTTVDVYMIEDERRVVERMAQHLKSRKQAAAPVTFPATAYNADDMAVLFGPVR